MAERIVLFGGGRMGSAMVRGWIAGGIAPGLITVVDPAPAPALAQTGVALNGVLRPELEQAIVLAVKPQTAGDLREELAALAGPDTLILSIMAGKTVANVAGLCPGARAIVRAMPNLPAAVGRGATVAFAAGCDARQRALADRLLASTGMVEWLDDEALVDAATGVSGSGPAYVFHLVECLAAAGIAAGLPADIAERLARATVAGAGALIGPEGKPAAELRRDVTSPGGTTAAGLGVLMADGALERLVTGTVLAAVARARELAG